MPKYDSAHRDALRAETEAKKNLVAPLVPLVLERARDLLDDRSKWTKGTVARDSYGGQCYVEDPNAVQWCAVGALDKCSREVWDASALNGTMQDGHQMLFHVAQEAAAPHIMQAAAEIRPEIEPYVVERRTQVSIPQINDHDARGGYTAVISGLYLATGKTIADRVAKFVKRSQAARKAWDTRRAKQVEEWKAYMARKNEEKAAREALARQTMVIGGTLPATSTVSPQINADAKKEVTFEMCHISLLDSAQIEALEALPFRFRRDFEYRTDKLTARDRAGTLLAYTEVMEAAGKGGEKVQEAVAEIKPEMPTGVYVRFEVDFPPLRRVDGARALARAFVLQAEALTRIKNLTMPGYRRLDVGRLHQIVTQVHALCRDTAWAIAEPEGRMPMPTNKFAPMKNHFWTAQGKNERAEEIHVGIFPAQKDAAQWCDRQNETQHDQEWGRGSAGPMHFVPKPLYNDPNLTVGAPDPARCIYPERTWDEADADQV